MIAQIFHWIIIALEVLLIFNVIIIVHELGHFLAARWRGLYVDEFAVWFGKPIWRKKIGGVWYALNSIPAGGYVKLPQMAPMDSIEGESDIPREQLKPVAPLDKIIVAFAGPLFSFLLALLLATIVWQIGKPVSANTETTMIGYVEKGGPADKAGLQVGDEILEVDGKPVKRFMGTSQAVTWNIIRSEGEKILFKVRRNGEVLDIWSGWQKEETAGWRRPSLRKVHIGPQFAPWVFHVKPRSPAADAGLQAGDLIETANGQPIFNIDDLLAPIRESRGEALALRVERSGQKVDVALPVPAQAPAKPDDFTELNDFSKYAGLDWGRMTFIHPGPWEQVTESVETIVNMVGALAARNSDVKASHFSGPVGIMNLYRRIFEAEEGWRLALAFSVFFNVNLALLNMLPLPVLDGGHITLAIVEAIRRKPANTRFIEILNTACALVLISFMLFVTFFDIGDFFVREKEAPEPPPAEASATPAPE